MPFRTDLEYDTLEQHKVWQLTAPLVYEGLEHKKGHDWPFTIIVPAGYVTDFISRPWLTKFFIRKDGPGKVSATLHDYLYKTMSLTMPREEADLIFLKALKEDPEKPSFLVRTLFYVGVRAGGSVFWQQSIQKRKEIQKRLKEWTSTKPS